MLAEPFGFPPRTPSVSTGRLTQVVPKEEETVKPELGLCSKLNLCGIEIRLKSLCFGCSYSKASASVLYEGMG